MNALNGLLASGEQRSNHSRKRQEMEIFHFTTILNELQK
jgi:hypothetical protein